MAAVISGRSSVEQDDAVVRKMRQTPRTPMKTLPFGKNGLSSAQRRRGLFQSASPAASEKSGSLGHMSPLSSSLESLTSLPDSPSFSPNGQCYYTTPLKSGGVYEAGTPFRDITVKSTLFPALTKASPAVRRSPRSKTMASPSIRRSMAALQSILSDGENRSCSQSLDSTPKSSRSGSQILSETPPSSVGTPPSQRKAVIPPSPTETSPSLSEANRKTRSVAASDFYGPTKTAVATDNFYGASKTPKVASAPSIKPVTPEDFYAPKPVGASLPPPASRPKLVIDTLVVRGGRSRLDSERSFMSGAEKRRRSASRSTSRSGKRLKGLVPGVWHGIKKPKKMNKNAPKPKPVLSPNTRIEKLKNQPVKRVRREKRLFESKPKIRTAGRRREVEDDGIIDTFPPPLIKRKKLPTEPVPAPEPDQSKKFLKFGAYRKATFQLNNMQLEFNKGNVRVKTPEKVRKVRVKKLHKEPLDLIDFSMPEPETTDIQKNVDDILQNLIDDDVAAPAPPTQPQQVPKMSDEQLLNILESPSTRITLVPASPSKMVTELHSSPQRALLANMSCLAINDFRQPDFGRLQLDTTAGLLSAASNVLNAENDEFVMNDDQENQGGVKVFPVFDPKTWKSQQSSVLTDVSNVQKSIRKKTGLVGDDQYLLDAGQKSIGIIDCKECGVMYQAGDYLDEVAHYNIHNHVSDLSFLGWKEERVVSRYQDGRVVMVIPTDPKPWLEKAKKVVGVVDLELGFSENTLTWTADKKIFLFICDKLKQVVGCLVSESCTQGYRMYPPVEGVDLDTCARDPTPCKIGISRMWTAVHRRRRGVASRLFQNLCRIAGNLQPDDVAFSIPSPDGKMLARSVIQRDDFKVYGFLSN